MAIDIAQELLWPLLAAGGVALGFAVGRWRRARARVRMKPWQSELEERVWKVVDAHLGAAEAEMSLAEVLEEVPKDFQHPAFRAAQIGYQVEHAVRLKASRMRVLPEGWEEKASGNEVRTRSPEGAPREFQHEPVRGPEEAGALPPREERGVFSRDGKLLPFGRRRREP